MSSTCVRTALKLRAFMRPAREHLPEGSVLGKNSSFYLRKKFDLMPGVLYGSTKEKVILATRQKDLDAMFNKRGTSFGNSLVSLVFEDGKEELALPRNLQLSVYTQKPMTCNFLRYDPQKGARMPIPFRFVDEDVSPGIKRGGFLNVCLQDVWVHITGEEIPAYISVSLAGLDVGDRITWDDLDLPPNIRLVKRNPKEKQAVICNIRGKHSIVKQVMAEKKAAREGTEVQVILGDDDEDED